MRKASFLLPILGLLAFISLPTTSAHAQATRTWVSCEVHARKLTPGAQNGPAYPYHVAAYKGVVWATWYQLLKDKKNHLFAKRVSCGR